jgi:hypothetical protein
VGTETYGSGALGGRKESGSSGSCSRRVSTSGGGVVGGELTLEALVLGDGLGPLVELALLLFREGGRTITTRREGAQRSASSGAKRPKIPLPGPQRRLCTHTSWGWGRVPLTFCWWNTFFLVLSPPPGATRRAPLPAERSSWSSPPLLPCPPPRPPLPPPRPPLPLPLPRSILVSWCSSSPP